MKTDLSRDTFDAVHHYSSVRLQQGRVLAEADWNEQADITRRRAEREAADVIGACGAPEAAAGFALSAATQPLDVYASGDHAWVVAEDGVILTTGDRGLTWSLLTSGTLASLRAVTFVAAANPSVGWAVGDRGTILKSTNGGMNWTPQPSRVTVTLRSVSAVDASLAWAVGDGGTLLSTIDGGTTWTARTIGRGRLHAVRFVDTASGFVAGQDGQLASTADGGVTWIARDGGTRGDVLALDFASALVGWAAGDDGFIAKTTDGGVTWTRQSTPVATRLHSIAFAGENEGGAVGDDGTALRTANGGATWSDGGLGTHANLRALTLTTVPISTPIPLVDAPADTVIPEFTTLIPQFTTVIGLIVGDDSMVARVSRQPFGGWQRLPAASISLGPGRLYVDGTMCEIEERASFYAQPDRRVGQRLAPAGTYLLYLDVWQRHLTYLEDPHIREIALGGPDTATRGRTVWQVRALPLPATSPPANCLSDVPALNDLAAPSAARLRARTEPDQIPTSVCEVGAAGGFRRFENQLYRVEVHAGAPAPAFTWSRENGSVAYGIVSIVEDPSKGETVVTLASRGLDDNLDLGVGDWVEFVDDDVALEGGAGPLFEFIREGNDPREIVVQGVVPDTVGRDPSRHPLLRRWDQKPAGGTLSVPAGTLPIQEGQWIDLEAGVQVWFEPGGTYRSGDYWLIPARTITGDVELPRGDAGEPLARGPHGIEHRYCRLGLVDLHASGTVSVRSDCRELFPPLTALTQLLYTSGEGQDGICGQELPQPLRVRVVRGSHPVQGARVRFAIEPPGQGHLVSSTPVTTLDVLTKPDGAAECRWILDPDFATSYQRVRATLLDAAGHDVDGQLVIFCATGTVSLHYEGGDDQIGAPGQRLEHLLLVHVSNGQRPVTGAKIRFTASSDVSGGDGVLVPAILLVSTGHFIPIPLEEGPISTGAQAAKPLPLQTQTGGGQTGAGPIVSVMTNEDGRAGVAWTLGTAGTQHVEAHLLDASEKNVLQRIVFSATFAHQLLYTSGDGQDGIPGQELPQPLAVRVVCGSRPVPGARVRFAVESGGGNLAGVAVGTPVDVTTGSNGAAECRWVLDPDLAPEKSYQRVRATLLDAAGHDVLGQFVVFCSTGTVSFEYVGGDGQEGQPGERLQDPLVVRVSNGQHPVANAPVSWLLASGAGKLVLNPNSSLTDVNGLAFVFWEIGSGSGRVIASLLDATGDRALQRITFAASVTPPRRDCLTVGTGGDIPVLTSDTLKPLLKEPNNRVCLCLLPDQDHVISNLVGGTKEIPKGQVTLRGCSGTQLILKNPTVFSNFVSFELMNVKLMPDPAAGLAFENCGDVHVQSVQAERDAFGPKTTPILRFTDISRSITLNRSRIFSSGIGVCFDDAKASVWVTDSEIGTALCFYGIYGEPNLPDGLLEKLSQRLSKVTFTPENPPGRLFVRDCRLGVVTLGEDMVKNLVEVGNGHDTLSGIFQTSTISGNVFTVSHPNAFVSQMLTLTACSFIATSGICVAEVATAVGNLDSGGVGTANRFWIITKPGLRRLDAANLALIGPPFPTGGGGTGGGNIPLDTATA